MSELDGRETDRWAEGVLAGLGERGPVALRVGHASRAYVGERLVLKIHPRWVPPDDLGRRLAAASALGDLVVVPASAEVLLAPADLTASIWPTVPMLTPDDVDDAMWHDLAVLLARLHRAPPPDLPPARPLERLHRAVAPVEGMSTADAVLVRRLAADLSEADASLRTVVHGDVHLGQVALVEGSMRLLDLDDLGLGDPVVDLARFAGFWAAGLMPDDHWSAFLDAYHSADGPALPTTGDPWPRLDRPARAAVVTAAANALTGARPYDLDERDALLAACRSMPPARIGA